MKYKVTYTLQREVSVIVDIKDKNLTETLKDLVKSTLIQISIIRSTLVGR